jgi:hypothetical protein
LPAVFRYQHARHTVESSDAGKIVPDNGQAGRLPRPDGGVQLIDGRFFELKLGLQRAQTVIH